MEHPLLSSETKTEILIIVWQLPCLAHVSCYGGNDGSAIGGTGIVLLNQMTLYVPVPHLTTPTKLG